MEVTIFLNSMNHMFYEELKIKRQKYNISQTKLARASEYTCAKISEWELGKSIPSQEDILRLNDVLSKMIENIDNHILDIRKKIILPDREKRKLPAAIKNATMYREQLAKNPQLKHNPYAQKLTKLYQCAQTFKTKSSPKAIALFSGCGGLSLGFAAAGFNLVGHVEIEDSANKIYEENFPYSELFGKDICKITDSKMKKWISKYENIDIIIGGPPCQGFSLAGKRDPRDIRNQLYKYYVHMVEIIRPKVFVMENVRLLTSMKTSQGQLFIDCILKSFSNVGYDVFMQEINAVDYGVPQSRERVILVGVRKDLQTRFLFPTKEYINPQNNFSTKHLQKYLTFRDATSDLAYLESGEVSKDPLHWSVAHPLHVIKWLRNVPEGHSAHENKDPALRPPSGFNTTYKRIMWNEPCSTISTNFSMISGCRNVHPQATRALTIREAARAQSFPDEFAFFGKWGDIRKAIGNAVPPILAETLAKAILKQIFKS